MSAATLVLGGEFTIFTAREIHGRLLATLGESADELTVDLSGVSEMDSAGLQLMMAARQEADKRGRTLRFTGLGPVVVDALKLCRLTDLVSQDESRP